MLSTSWDALLGNQAHALAKAQTRTESKTYITRNVRRDEGGDEASDAEMYKDAITTASTHARGVKISANTPCSYSGSTGQHENWFKKVQEKFSSRAPASLSGGGIISRKQWGAAPPTSPLQNMSQAPTKIILHETQGPSNQAVKDIQQYHQYGRKKDGKKPFSDIGYHFLIDAQGRIYEGRPLNKIGAHMPGANDAIGIALMSDSRRKSGTPPTPAQKAALENLVRRLKQKIPSITSMDTHGNAQHDPSHCTDCAKLLTPWAKKLSQELARTRGTASISDIKPGMI